MTTTRSAEVSLKNEQTTGKTPSSSESNVDAKKVGDWEKKTIVNYDSNEEWFNSCVVLVNNQKLDRGTHSYMFQFILPHNIPASFQHSIGTIMYSVEAFIEMPLLYDIAFL